MTFRGRNSPSSSSSSSTGEVRNLLSVLYSLKLDSVSSLSVSSCVKGQLSAVVDRLISVRLDVHPGRACVCEFSRSSVADLYVCVFGRGLLATCHPPLTLAIGGIHYFHLQALQGIPSSFKVG